MKKLYFLSIFLTIFIALIAVSLFFTNNTLAENSFSFPNNGSKNGLQEIVLTAGGGKVTVTLPGDIRPGDTISGTVSAEADGKTEQERVTNSAELSGYVVEIADAKQSEWKKIGNKLTAIIKFALTEGKTASVLLKSKTGAVVSSVPMAVQSLSMTMPPTSPPTANDFKLPTIGQQGRPITISGPFDGNSTNTTVNINSKEVEIIAESPRKVIFVAPPEPTVNAPINLKEGNVEMKGQYRNLGVNLTSPKTNLMKGEKTTVRVNVEGLQGITSPVPLQLVTTGSANMLGGNTQNIQIAPNQVGTNGIYTQNFSLTGIQAGAFNVTATVLADPDAEEQEQARCKCTCALNDPPILSAGRDKIKGGGTTYSYKASIKTATCEGENCTVVLPHTYSWSVVAADSTATYTVQDATKASDKFKVDVTGSGTLKVTVTVTVTCSDGSKCSATGSKTFDVKK